MRRVFIALLEPFVRAKAARFGRESLKRLYVRLVVECLEDKRVPAGRRLDMALSLLGKREDTKLDHYHSLLRNEVGFPRRLAGLLVDTTASGKEDAIAKVREAVRRYGISSLFWTAPEFALPFAERIGPYDEGLRLEALRYYLKTCHRKSYSCENPPDEETLRYVGEAVFTQISAKRPPDAEALRELARFGPYDTRWFEEVHTLLCRLEASKTRPDDETPTNALLALHKPGGPLCAPAMYASLRRWFEGYESLVPCCREDALAFAKRMERLFEEMLERSREFFNIYGEVEPDAGATEMFVAAFRGMWSLAKERDGRLYADLLVLAVDIADGEESRVPKARKALAKEAGERLIERARKQLRENPAEAARIVGSLMDRSRYRVKRTIDRLLEHLYFELEAVDRKLARKEVRRIEGKVEEFYRRYDYGGPDPWLPVRVAGDPSADAALLQKLVDIDDPEVRRAVRDNPAAPEDAVLRLKADKSLDTLPLHRHEQKPPKWTLAAFFSFAFMLLAPVYVFVEYPSPYIKGFAIFCELLIFYLLAGAIFRSVRYAVSRSRGGEKQ